MNKVEFMRQLESLLQNISEQERREALQYYGDYFDDAGPENEQAVIEALGNPARVAENIKRDLYGAGYGDGYEARRTVTGRELTEYGAAAEEDQRQGDAWQNGAGQGGTAQGAMSGAAAPIDSAAAAAGPWQNNSQPVQAWENAGQGAQEKARKPKEPLSGGMLALIVILCVFCLPVILGLLGGALGVAAGALGVLLSLLAAWFCLILGFGIAALVCILVGIFLSFVGVAGIGIHPMAAMGLIGGGFITVGVGIFFLILTVAMAGVATPAVFRWIGKLFTRKKKAA